MGEEKTVPEWYKKPEVDVKIRDAFYEKAAALQYRQIMVDIPAKMMLELGRIALKEKMTFSELIEKLLEDYLASQGIKWRETPDRTEEWLRYGSGATDSNIEYVKKKLRLRYKK